MIDTIALLHTILGNSQHTPTHLASLFVRLQRCRNSFVASYAPISTNGRQTKILRNMGSLLIAPYLITLKSNLPDKFSHDAYPKIISF